MDTCKLTELCRIQYGYAFDSASFTEDASFPPLVRIRDVKRGFSETYYSGNYSEEYIVRRGDILIGMDGEFNIARWQSEPALLNQRVCKIIPNQQVDGSYLLFALTKILKKIEDKTAFVTVKHLSAKELNKIELRIPNYEQQMQISSTLEKALSIISRRQYQLAKLDELVKCRFVEMFIGKGYPRRELQFLIQDGTSISYGIVQPGDDGTGNIGLLRPVDFHNGSVVLDNLKYIGEAINNLSRKTILEGNELLITVRGTTGLTALTNSNHRGMNVTRGIAVVKYDGRKIVPEYLHAFMSSDESQTYIREHTRGATLQQINLSDLRIQSILVPPFVEQQTFAAFVQRIDKLRFISGRKRVLRPSCTNELALLPQIWYKGCDIRHYPICNRRTSPVELCHCDD